jgi:Phage terminase large subunit (GpA)
MATKVTVNLPAPHPAQQACLDSAKRFNLVVGGEDAGKTTLAIEVLLMGAKGAFNTKRPVAYIHPKDHGAVEARRAVVKALGALVRRRVNARRIELTTGGVIDFISLEQTRDLFESYALVVVDDACQADQLQNLWDDVLLPSLHMHAGHAWIFSPAFGKNNDFFKLWDRPADEDWARHVIRSFDNPHLPDEVRDAALDVTDVEFAQRFDAEFLDVAISFTAEQRLIRPDETFLQWCERLEETGLQVDGKPFTLSNRPAMRFIYELIPSTVQEAFERVDVIMKCTQVGFTVFEMLAMIYMALRFAPAKIGMFMPGKDLASGKSSERFMPIVRTMPEVYALFSDESKPGKKGGEGNILIRNLGSSRFHFLWTSGKTTTESFPMDVVSFDEVQGMKIADMEKTRERMSASPLRYTLMGSTANWPDRDIHWWYKKGTQHQFHTECPHCSTFQVLDDHFPNCIAYDPDAPRLNERERAAGMKGEYRYRCHECHGWIDDPQQGEWRAKNPDSSIRSVHFPQFLSPTISPRKIITGYHEADDMQNFWNRVLGKPYTDPSQVPVNLEMLAECARLGMEAGLVWKSRARDTFMGLDQMGNFIVATIGERMPDGRLAIIHLEYIFISPTAENPDASPWDRADELMAAFGVQVCVVETLPNYDSAKSFARRHDGKVFLASYGNMDGEMLQWGDTIKLNSSENRTDEELRDRFTVRLDQYKVMQLALGRIQKKMTLFPDPDGLVQEVLEKGKRRMAAVCKEYAFFHFTRTALVAEKDEEEKKFKRRVVKVGIDPHTSYAYMLLVVAWARAHGTSMFILPQEQEPVTEVVGKTLSKIPVIAQSVAQVQQFMGDTCGRCIFRDDANRGFCSELEALTMERDPGCMMFQAR